MKTMICLFALFLSLVAFAEQDPACYTVTLKQDQHLTSAVPIEICLESVSLQMGETGMQVESALNPELFKDMKRTRYAHGPDESHAFTGTAILFQTTDATCTAVEDVKLKMSGYENAERVVQISQLDFTVVREYTDNSCTGPVRTETYVYKLRD
ncbi:MAG: hypothetical protein ACAH59_02415 [Pseudobdellovibrionaceae bacterium]